jgi:hypothetical protein
MLGRVIISSILMISILGLGILYFILNSIEGSLYYSKIIQFHYFIYKYVKYNITEFLHNGHVFAFYCINTTKPVYVVGILNCNFHYIIKLCREIFGNNICVRKVNSTFNLTYLRFSFDNCYVCELKYPKIEVANIHIGVYLFEYLKYDNRVNTWIPSLGILIVNCGNVPSYICYFRLFLKCEYYVKEGNLTKTCYACFCFTFNIDKWLFPCGWVLCSIPINNLVYAKATVYFNALCCSYNSTTVYHS